MQFFVSNSAELKQVVSIACNSNEQASISLKSGVYEIDKTVILGDNTELIGQDGVIFKGTKRVALNKAMCKDGIYIIDLKEFGISDTGKFGLGPYVNFWEEYDIPKPHMTEYGPSMELYFGDRKMNLSRYPKNDYIYVEKALGETPIEIPGINGMEGKTGTREGIFIPSETEVFDNNRTSDMLLVGYWSYNWASQRHIITNYDKANKVITVDEEFHDFGYIDTCKASDEGRGKFYILNLLSAVREPGDWYIDRTENKLYLIPFENQDFVDIALCENMFEARDKENITIKNISVFGCRKSAFEFNGCKNVAIEDCDVNHVGAWGVIADDCLDTTISGCHIHNVGGGGISCSGGNRSTLTPSGNVVKGNIIHDIAYWHKTYLAGIELNGVGIQVYQNRIYDVPHFAIVFQGNDHIIEKNTIKNACYESNDAGTIYAGRDYTCRGNIIRYNCIQDLESGGGCIGMYFDDGLSTCEVYGNIFSNLSFIGIMLGGGRNYDIHDNYFFGCNVALHFDNRIMADTGYYYDKLMAHLNEVPYRSEVWKNKYPELYGILDDEPKVPKYNKFRDNTIVGGCGIAVVIGANGESTEKIDVASLLERKNNKYIKTESCVLHHLYGDDTQLIWED